MMAPSFKPIALSVRLLARYWPQLIATALIGNLAADVLLKLAAHVAIANHMAGLAFLTLMVLGQLVVTVVMFHIVRPALPCFANAAGHPVPVSGPPPGGPNDAAGRFANVVSIALLPFLAYYAAWGYLGNIVREYSRAALALAPFGSDANVLDVMDSRWLLISVAISWAARKLAKQVLSKSSSTLWHIAIVACETNWIFVGLFVISQWQDYALNWLKTTKAWSLVQSMELGSLDFAPAAYASIALPVDRSTVPAASLAADLFFFMLVPLIWLAMAALIYGLDLGGASELKRTHRHTAYLFERYAMIPRFVREFVEHFVKAYRSRYLPIANSVRLTVGTSVTLLAISIIGYRLLDWSSAWLWFGASRLIGPHDLETWQVASQALSLLFGSPFQDSSRGFLIEPVRICFLAAVLNTAVARLDATKG
ncbi:hypothetical protein IB262_33310 [Ensifer sp. ENS02]|uniref:hypothetical protein n=1 Tax=Ensifer sp. ENS02 TaxID=2769290 RepID=UPI00177B56F4|nr:hypothetical protein [Ensifer sp. ENS02]MBD9524756.1 hypothetical protein [Ensifer sp. ENS02]